MRKKSDFELLIQALHDTLQEWRQWKKVKRKD